MKNKDLIHITVSKFFAEKIGEEESQTIEFDGFDDFCNSLLSDSVNYVSSYNVYHIYFNFLNSTLYNKLLANKTFISIVDIPISQKYYVIDNEETVEITKDNFFNLPNNNILNYD